MKNKTYFDSIIRQRDFYRVEADRLDEIIKAEQEKCNHIYKLELNTPKAEIHVCQICGKSKKKEV
jgi:hypothetical protein